MNYGPEANFKSGRAVQLLREAATDSRHATTLCLVMNSETHTHTHTAAEKKGLWQIGTEVPKSAEMKLNHTLLRLTDSQSKQRHESPG